MRSLNFAVKVRRLGMAVSSDVGWTGAVTMRVGGSVSAVSSDTISSESGVFEGITMGSFSYTLKCKLQPVICLTLIGTEGVVIGRALQKRASQLPDLPVPMGFGETNGTPV